MQGFMGCGGAFWRTGVQEHKCFLMWKIKNMRSTQKLEELEILRLKAFTQEGGQGILEGEGNNQRFLAGCFKGYSASEVTVAVLHMWEKPFSRRYVEQIV